MDPLPLCPFTVSLDIRQEPDGETVLVNPGTSSLGIHALPRQIRFVVSFSLVLSKEHAGAHPIRVEVLDPDGGTIAENDDDYEVPGRWDSPSGHARMVTIPVEARIERRGEHRIRLWLDKRAVEPDWPIVVV